MAVIWLKKKETKKKKFQALLTCYELAMYSVILKYFKEEVH